MSGYNRSCSRADSAIVLVAQCAAALSMMPASAPSCWAQGVTAASYNEYAIWVFSFGWDFMGETIGEARFSCQQAYPYRILHLRHLPAASMSAVHPVSRERNPSLERSLLALLAHSLMRRHVRSRRKVTCGCKRAIRVLTDYRSFP